MGSSIKSLNPWLSCNKLLEIKRLKISKVFELIIFKMFLRYGSQVGCRKQVVG